MDGLQQSRHVHTYTQVDAVTKQLQQEHSESFARVQAENAKEIAALQRQLSSAQQQVRQRAVGTVRPVRLVTGSLPMQKQA